MKRAFRISHERGRASDDVRREIELHLDMRARELEAAGLAPEAARRAALEAFGDRAAIEDEVRGIRRSTIQRRRRRDWLHDALQDVVIGARLLRRTPAFTLVAVLTLAIGIGANTAIFGVLRSVLLRPLPYPHPEQLVQVWADHRALGRAQPEWLSPPDFLDERAQNTTLTGLVAYTGWGPDLTGAGDPERLAGLTVSGDYFDVLGARPVQGRLFSMSDDDAGAAPVVVLSNAFWQRRFGSDPSVVGRVLLLNGVPMTVVGVLSGEFRAPIAGAPRDIFRTFRRPADAGCGRGCVTLRAIGRMRPGVTVAAVQADMGRIAAHLATEYPSTNARVGAWVIPLHEQITSATKPALVALAAAVALVLLIGCVNLANLLLARGATRSRELGVRAALGAGRWRVVRQLLTENLLLAGIGGALGVTAGVLGTRVLGTLVPDSVRAVQPIQVDGVVLAFAAGITVAAAALFGLLPALHATRAGLMSALRSGVRVAPHGGRLRQGLVVIQLSLAVVLLVGAGLLIRSFLTMQRVDLGYRSSGLYLTTVQFPPSRYRDAARVRAANDGLLARLRSDPAIRLAEATDLPVLSGGDQDISAIPVGTQPLPGQPPSIWYRSVTPGYLGAMQMRVVAGRGLTPADRAGGARIGVINQTAAERFFPGQNAVGRQLADSPSPDAERITIVGIVASSYHDGPDQPYKAELFVPMAQAPSRAMTFVLEPSRDVAALTMAVRRALHDFDPLIPVSRIDAVEELAGETVALPRLYATLMGLFAAAAISLAALGVYGVMAYAVTQRQREIGVRLALGATPAGIGRMMLGQSGRLAVVGAAIGMAGALLLGRVLATLLFGVSRYDIATFVGVPLVLASVTFLASWAPARRAMRLDPLAAIREE